MGNKKYIQLHFVNIAEEYNDQLIAVLAHIGYTGFEETEDSLKACIAEESFNNDELDAVLKLIPVSCTKSVIEEKNWNAQWERSFEPIVVNDFAGIRAAFHQPVNNVKHEIIITPKMSFGTGHHATTYMMIEQMELLDFKNKSVLDFGTGTAVLAILAEKRGASVVDAIDNDEWSIENAIENIAANNCTKINVYKADAIEKGKKYDIVLANINLNVILENIPAITEVSKKDTDILLSGFLEHDKAALLQFFLRFKILHLATLQKAEWICIHARMN